MWLPQVDEAALRRLLDVTVRQTHNFSVEKLEKLHSRFSQRVHRFRGDGDKTPLIKVSATGEGHGRAGGAGRVLGTG